MRRLQAVSYTHLDVYKRQIVDCEIACPISGTRNWTEVRQFNLMFSTQMGSTAEGANTIYPVSYTHLRNDRSSPAFTS